MISMNQPTLDGDKYQEQLSRYHESLLPEFEAKEEINLKKRLDKFIEIVNKQCPLSVPFIRFQITSTLFNNMLTSIKPEISQHTKVQSTKCENRILNENDYKKPARNMLNRWKPAILANHVLHHIIFINLYNHCYEICRLNKKDDNEILKLFINILDSILSATVKFSQTKPQPLIFHAIFHRDNQFKRACVKFLTHFKVIQYWDQTAKKAEIRFNSFKQCVQKINYIHMTSAIIPIMLDHNKMRINQHNQPCCIHYQNIIKQYIIYTEIEYRMNKYDRLSNKEIFQTVIHNVIQYICFGIEFVTINTIEQRHSYQLQSMELDTNLNIKQSLIQNYSNNNKNNIDFNRQRSYSDNQYKNQTVRHDNNLFLAINKHRHSTTCILPLYKSNNNNNHPIIQQSQSNHMHGVYNNRNSYRRCPMAPTYQHSLPINHMVENNRMQIQQQQQQLGNINMYSSMQNTYNTQSQPQHMYSQTTQSVGWIPSNYQNTNYYNIVENNNINERDESSYDHNIFMPSIENDREQGMDADGDHLIQDRNNNDHF